MVKAWAERMHSVFRKRWIQMRTKGTKKLKTPTQNGK